MIEMIEGTGGIRRVQTDELGRPVAPAPPPVEQRQTTITVPATLNGDPLQGWTSADNAEADSLCPGRHLAQRDDQPEPSKPPPEPGNDFVSIETRLLAEVFGVTGWHRGQTDQRLWLSFAGTMIGPSGTQAVEWRHSGQPHVVHRKGNRALIIHRDLSDSPNQSTNQQLRDFACLVYGNSQLLQEIGVVVVQPRVTHKPEICLYTLEDIQRATAELFERVKASNDPLSRRIPGDVQCRECRAKLRCVEYQQWAAKTLPIEAGETRALFAKPIETWTPAERTQFLEAIPEFHRAWKLIENCLLILKNKMRETEYWNAYAGMIDGARLPSHKKKLRLEYQAQAQADKEVAPGFMLEMGTLDKTLTDPEKLYDRYMALPSALSDEEKKRLFFLVVSVNANKFADAVKAVTGSAKGTADLYEGISHVERALPTIVKIEEERQE